MRIPAGAALMALALISGTGVTPAHADINNPALNGKFAVTNNGEWARTNDSYHNEAVVRDTWTITSSCVNPVTCSGTISSGQGWTTNLLRIPGMWKVIRYLPDWENCGDGTSATGRQVYTFYPIGQNPDLPIDPDSNTYSGESVTTGPSGGCGFNSQLEIAVPFKMVKIG
jgi:hypothetical protein